MEWRMFKITLISARNLDVRETQKTKVYAKISIAGHPNTEKRTPVDKKGGANPAWNFTTTCMIGKQAVEHDVVKLEIKLYRSRALGDKYIGKVCVSFKELFNLERTLWGRLRTLFSCPKGAGVGKTVKYSVKKNGGSDSSGVLKFSYRFGEVVIVNQPSGHGSTSPLVAQLVVLFIRVVIAAALSIDIPFSWVGV
ncbi:Protein SRC2 [Vitis vinifera]|uniref:Protein SRC2 n=1 Tax=Vitis vinifera TaxID=29760 RepID=A0A438GFU4_VITVI|nr:Protein SRC2 [Vitis vinifera]